MATLYVTQPGATLRRSAGSLVITAPNEDGEGSHPVLEVEPHRLELVALLGRAHITSDALHTCLREGIAVAWFRRNGRFLARIVPSDSRSADLRLLQYGVVNDPHACLVRARAVVNSKLINAREVLEALQSNRPGSDLLAQAISTLDQARLGLEDVTDLAELLGHEGSGARTYFAALGSGFQKEIQFSTRERRPPPDPANALLSFGYVLLTNLLAGRLEARGLDPALGFYHAPRAGRPSLALDLLEELRHPVVDRFVVRGCNLRIFTSDAFEADQRRPGGVRLTRTGLRKFFEQWERQLLRPLRDREASEPIAVMPLIERQIERLVVDLRGGATYRPFHFGD